MPFVAKLCVQLPSLHSWSVATTQLPKKHFWAIKPYFFLFLVPNPILFDDSNPFIYILAQNNPFGPVRILKGAKNDFRPKSPILGAQIGQIWFKIKILGGNFYSIYSYPSPK